MSGIAALAVVSEIFPLIKTGGLADVAGALPGALAAESVHVVSLIPGYPSVLDKLDEAVPAGAFAEFFGGSARLLRGKAGNLDLFVLDAPHLYARQGDPYRGPGGHDWDDNAVRFTALGACGAEIAQGAVGNFVPDIVHAHDWQGALTLAHLHYRGGSRPATVMTVHNLAFQGQFPASLLPMLGLPPSSFAIDGIEFYGNISFLKAGLLFADRITTVSPTYAMEIQGSEAGMGFEGLLRSRGESLHGILNGIDEVVWNPAADPSITAAYSPLRLTRRSANKAALQARLGLNQASDVLLFGAIGRLAWQKGFDLLLPDLDGLLPPAAQFVLLGSGEPELEAGLIAAAAANPGRVAAVIGYDEALAHQIQAGADALLMPSRFEPCGLTQLAALRYGALPVVSRVGGLADSVIDANEAALASGTGTGLQFAPVTRENLRGAVRRIEALWHEPRVWRRLQRNAMRSDVSWRRPARRYAALYRSLIADHAQGDVRGK